MNLAMREIAAALETGFVGDGSVGAVSTDTRCLQPGCLFVALTGERFDGHDYVAQALEGGAAFAVVSRPGDYPPDRVLRVGDTRQALMQIARLHRRNCGVKVVGVTGSVGKTTTKEMAACALSARYPTHKNEMNLNNEVGLSQTILAIEDHHRAAVLEMGMDGPGQIAPLSRCAEPDVGIVTNIGVSHLEAMGTREAIRDEKLSITAGMDPQATLVLCGDDPLLWEAAAERPALYYGIDNERCPVRGARLREFSTHTTFEIRYDGNRFDAGVPTLGRHNVLNALAAFCAAVCLKVPPQDAIAALKNYRPAGMRQNIVRHNQFTVVEDCYNASPDSMRAALTTLAGLECEGRRFAVLSDMLELGSLAESAHYEAGRQVAQCNIDGLFCTGDLARGYVRGARDEGLAEARHFPDAEALFQQLRQTLRQGDVAWFKASRGMHLETVINRIYKEC